MDPNVLDKQEGPLRKMNKNNWLNLFFAPYENEICYN